MSKADLEAELLAKKEDLQLAYDTCEALRKRNGDLMNVIMESCPQRISDGEIIPISRLEQKAAESASGMRTSVNPCTSCDEHWEEPSRRGRMASKCPGCREAEAEIERLASAM